MERRASPPGNHNTGRARPLPLPSRWSGHSHSDCAPPKSCLRNCCSGDEAMLPVGSISQIIGGKGSETDTGKETGFGLWSNSRPDRCRHHPYLSTSESNQDAPGSRHGGEHAHTRNLQKLAEGPESDAEQRASSPSRGNRNGQERVREEGFQ